MMERNKVRFATDEMLGSLSRWLRILGYDTEYLKGMKDEEIEAFVLSEERVLLTRDKDLARRLRRRALCIKSDEIRDQLQQVIIEFDLKINGEFTRCTLCNGELREVPIVEVEKEVPQGVILNTTEFYRCNRCGKIYWKGSHWNNIMKQLNILNSSAKVNNR
ncbi:MAG: Mut7-C RNAse domain-containing protein [Methanomassiliicoccales archaeon]